MDTMTVRGTRWGIMNGRGMAIYEMDEGVPIWTVTERPLFGSRAAMLEINRKLRAGGVRAKLVNFPDGWTPPEPLL